ncbi:MAG: GTP pyrophosphokinase family protein [Lachnospiraceae bacterium]|nr:GTP pyrophosphokinase family protein [Lachnospiraceae bacterium]
MLQNEEFIEEADKRKWYMFLYESAKKKITTKLEILNDDFQRTHKYNPIEYIKARIKSPESISRKLIRNGYEDTLENMWNNIHDVVGVRLVCSFIPDIYTLQSMIGNQQDLKLIKVKDYIKEPKESGYKSFHMIVSLPVFSSFGEIRVKVEIQIRTIAMDFWASLEHKTAYKFEGKPPEYITKELRETAEMITELETKMLHLNEEIRKYEKLG